MRKNEKTLSDKVSPDYLHEKQGEDGVISNDGYIHAVIARLIEYSILELHKYVRIFFIFGVKIPVVTLRLRGGVMDPIDSFSPFLL